MIKFTIEYNHTEEEKKDYFFSSYLEGPQRITSEFCNDSSLLEIVPGVLNALNSFGFYIGEARMRRIEETLEHSEAEWLDSEKEDSEYSDDDHDF